MKGILFCLLAIYLSIASLPFADRTRAEVFFEESLTAEEKTDPDPDLGLGLTSEETDLSGFDFVEGGLDGSSDPVPTEPDTPVSSSGAPDWQRWDT